MRAFKFLDAEGRAPFTGTPWEPGAWVDAHHARPCREGVHGCGVDDLARWLDADLWIVELDGEVVGGPHKIVGSRGRLLTRVDEYRSAVRELAEDGAWRSRDRAVAALGGREPSTALAAVMSLDELMSFGDTADDATFEGRAVALAADAAYFARHGLPAQSPFVAACSAGHTAAGPTGDQGAFDAGYEAERVHQSAWLAARLRLR